MSKGHNGSFTDKEIEVSFDKKLTDKEWDELFSKSKESPKCDGSCTKASDDRLYVDRCNHCGFVR